MKKKTKEKKINIGADLKWATAHLSIGAVSQYSHCIVTQWGWKVAGLKGKIELQGWYCIAIEVGWLGKAVCHNKIFVS